MLKITRQNNEKFDRMLRRFNRSVQQSGILTLAKKKRFREPELTRRARRIDAIRQGKIREARRKRKEGY